MTSALPRLHFADPADSGALRAAIDLHGVVQVDAHDRLAAGTLAVARALGTPMPPRQGAPVHPEEPLLAVFGLEGSRDLGQSLHHDYTGLPSPPGYIVLHVVVAPPDPPTGTWVDTSAVYAGLDAATQARLDGLAAVHHAYPRQLDPGVARNGPPLDEAGRRHGPKHSLVQHGRRRGRPFLFLPVRRDSVVEGMTPGESYDLLCRLWDAVETSTARMHAGYGQGCIFAWNNRNCLHDRGAWPNTAARETWLVNVAASG